MCHSRPQRPRSFWSAPRIVTSGQVQRHSSFEWICKHIRLRPEPIRFVRLDSEHAQSDGKSVNRGLPLLDMARGRYSWCWPKGARPLGTRMAQPQIKDTINEVKYMDVSKYLWKYSWRSWMFPWLLSRKTRDFMCLAVLLCEQFCWFMNGGAKISIKSYFVRSFFLSQCIQQ